MVAPGSTNRQHKLRPGGFCGTMYDSTSSPATLLLSNMARGALGLPPLLRHLYQLSKKSVLERQQPVWSAVSSSWNPGRITGLHHHCKLLNSLLLNKLEWVQGYILILIVLPSSPRDQREKGKGQLSAGTVVHFPSLTDLVLPMRPGCLSTLSRSSSLIFLAVWI